MSKIAQMALGSLPSFRRTELAATTSGALRFGTRVQGIEEGCPMLGH
jgi:hypothetical protein